MEKKQLNQKPSPLTLRKETLRRLADSVLLVAAGARGRIPVGFADDTTPIYSDVEGP